MPIQSARLPLVVAPALGRASRVGHVPVGVGVLVHTSDRAVKAVREQLAGELAAVGAAIRARRVAVQTPVVPHGHGDGCGVPPRHARRHRE